MGSSAKDIDNLSPQKRALLDLLLRKKNVDLARVRLIPQKRAISRLSRKKNSNLFPLSFAQQRLWLIDQLEPGSNAYNVAAAYRIKGLLNRPILEKSLNEILRRHEVLRATFSTIDGQPCQDINAFEFRSLNTRDISDLPEDEREGRARQLATIEARQPFDLAQRPLFRMKLLRLAENDHVMLITMHHIVSDGWSIDILHRELSTLYQAFSTGKPSPLPELPIQYTDFAAWQRQWLTGTVMQTQLDYWKEQLGEHIPVLELPTDRPRPPVQTYNGAKQTLLLSEAITELLMDLSRKEGVTLFMTLLAAFKVLVHHYTGQEDICIGAPIANRNRKEIELLIGFFINTLVMRTDLSANPTFQQLLSRVCRVALGAYAHQDMPFERLVEELQPERDLSRSPLFQVFFNMLSFERVQLQLRDLEVEDFPSSRIFSKFDLTMQVSEHEHKIQLDLIYNTDLFEGDAIAFILDTFETLLENIVEDPQRRLSELSLLNGSKRLQLTGRGNLVQHSLPFIEFRKQDIEQSIPRRFEQQVKMYPENVAVKTSCVQWTYDQLNQTANRMARQILASCKSEGERIGLLFDHGAQMIAAIFAVLKTGRIYVPLDPSMPERRIAYMLDDSQVDSILTNDKNLALAESLGISRMQIINIDNLGKDAAVDNIGLAVSTHAGAYILYTSGSEGNPKGVIQTHRNVLGHIRNYSNGLHISNYDKLTLFSNYSFDAAMMDMMGALLNGATLCPMDMKEDSSVCLSEWLNREEITVYHSTPTLYRYFLSTLAKENFQKIRLVVLGGEEVYKKDFDMYKKHFSPECIFVNTYGPTESTIALQYFLDKQTRIARSSVPVGYPVDDTEILLLNRSGEETEVYGEIAIRSPHVAAGYWQREEMTRKVFVPDPDGGNSMIYRTGDMGRLLPDGSIEFKGRKDLQAKIRGYRLEPGEVEFALSNHVAISDCAVAESSNDQGENELIAYIVSDESPSSLSLRSYLRDVLPAYMIPSRFIQLDAIPLIHNGKTDYAALASLGGNHTMKNSNFAPPTRPLEKRIAEIWQHVLGVDTVGLHDKFFDLGGHSLMAVKAISLIEKEFGTHMPFREFFNQTLGQFSASCEEKLPSTKFDYANKQH